MFSHGGVLHRDLEAPIDGQVPNPLIALIGSADLIPAAPMTNEDAQPAEGEAAEGEQTATEEAGESATPAMAVTDDAAAGYEGPSMVNGDVVDPTGLDSVAHMLAMAQQLHDAFVSEGREARERLISEGQTRHDRVVAEATAVQEELLSAGKAKYDEFVSSGGARHDALISEAETLLAEATAEHEHLITEARQRSADIVADAQQERAEAIRGLDEERLLRQKEIIELRTFERDLRAHLKNYFDTQLTDLERVGTNDAG